MNLEYLAQRIRDFRKQRNFTLEQLAERSQLTQSVLSKVENSRVTPSLVALGRIASALGITLSELLKGVDEERKIMVVSARDLEDAERQRSRTGVIYRALAPTRREKRMGPYLLEIPAGSSSKKEEWAHDGEKFIMVIKGAIELLYGDERYRLRRGDCAYFDANEKHRILGSGDQPAEVLCVVSGADAGRRTAPEI